MPIFLNVCCATDAYGDELLALQEMFGVSLMGKARDSRWPSFCSAPASRFFSHPCVAYHHLAPPGHFAI